MAVAVVVVGGIVVWQHLTAPAPVVKTTPLPSSTPKVAAGTPLDTSKATINVLTPGTDDVPFGEVSITVLPQTQPEQTAPTSQATASLALLLPVIEQAYAQGGPSARQMATLGLEQAQATYPAAVEAYTALRNATPENGPLTPAVLLLETSRVLTLDPHVPAQTTTIVAETATTPAQPGMLGWLRHHLNRFVTVRHTNQPEPTADTAAAWTSALHTVQQSLARNQPSEAALLLGQPPLASDKRLDVLRHLVAEYTDLQTRLAAVRQATLPLITGGGQ